MVVGRSVYTAGITDGETDTATTELRKLTTDGDPLWAQTLPNLSFGKFVSVAVSGEAHVYVVTGVRETTRIYYDGTVTITKFDGTGKVLWDETLTPEPYWD